ncbi:MAG TPA: hypothetical protein ENI35_00045 [Candidatus Desulfofervidus auxilii]|uniref:Type I restriction modification DNA specificity domain-containing protein n=1 Tax=Desulfofervidus auxilii TaxID=1621989 RepID=A0A7C1ZKW2_DESA2|nr:hypothetical protein [Candidatus Desulfofervidus auxilii]
MKQQSLKIFLKEETGPYELPKGWQWVKLGEVLKEDRKTINPQDYPAENFWLVTMDCVESNTGKLLKKINLCGKEIKSTKYQFNFNHVLYGKLRPYLNKVYAVPEGERGICTTEFIPFIPLNADKKYIAFYLRKKEVIEFAMNNLTGTRQPRVNIEALLSFQIPLPSLPEQKRIVARIEALFSKIDEIKRLRKEANDLAKTLLQSALHEVFSKADEKGWKWVRLGEVLNRKPQYGLTAKASKETLNIRYLRISDITDQGNLKNNDPRFLDLNEQEFNKYRLYEGDILIARSGSVGRVYLHHDCEQKVVFASYLIRFRLDTNQIIPKFFFYYGLSPLYKKYIEDTLRIVAQPNINAKEYSNLQIPLPPLEEQKRIIAYLDQISEKQKTLLKIYADIDNQITELKQSILTKAFRGQLGKQNFNNDL